MTEVRLMKKSEIADAISVWTEVGLPEGTHTLETFLEVDPKGYYVAVENGRIVGTCAAIVQNGHLASVGMYAVRPSHQGKGIGLKTWKKALEHAGDVNCYLTAVPEHFNTYNKKAGFGVVDNSNIILWSGKHVSLEKLVKEVEGVDVGNVTPEMIDRVIEYDQDIIGYNRATLIKSTVKQRECVSLLAIANGRICGYGSLRKDNLGGRLLGPLYADTSDVAELLLFKLTCSLPSPEQGGLKIMGIDANPSSVNLASKLCLERVTTCPRLYTKKALSSKFEKVYNVVNWNFTNV